MNLFKTLTMVGLVGVGTVYGISADTNTAKSDLQQKIEESKEIFVYLPFITPFDSNPKAKAFYLEQYQAGYRNVIAELYHEQDLSRLPFNPGAKESLFNAFTQGWADGIHKALKDHPEKMQVCPTIYKTDTRGILSSPDTGLYIDSSKAGVNLKK